MAEDNKNKELKTITPQSLVTERSVKAALAADKGENAVLNSWTVEDFTKRGDNYACVVSSVKIKFTLNGHTSDMVYIVKLNPCRNYESFEEFWHMLFVKELKFYTTLVPELNSVLESAGLELLRLPRCFYGILESGYELIFLEDLRVRGFKMYDRKKGMDMAHLKLVIEELGKLHAASILLNKRYKSSHENILFKHEYLKRDYLTYSDNASETMLPIFEEFFSNTISLLEKTDGYERVIAWVEGLKPQLSDIIGKQMLSNRCNVICHGDCWNNNTLFRYNDGGEPVEVMLLDLQLCRYASPMTDLNYLLYSSVTGDVRRLNLETLFSLYFVSFKDTVEAGEVDMPFTEEELEREFREKNQFGAFIAMMLVPFILMESEDAPDMSQGTDIQDLTNDIKAKSLAMMNNNPLFKSRFLSMFDEFIEVGLIA